MAVVVESGAMAMPIATPIVIAISLGIDDDVTHVSETCLCDLLAVPVLFSSPSECTVVSLQSGPNGDVLYTRRGKIKKDSWACRFLCTKEEEGRPYHGYEKVPSSVGM